MMCEGETAGRGAGSEDVDSTRSKDVDRIVARVPAPGFRRDMHGLRVVKKEREKLAGKREHEAQQPPATLVAARESQDGINREQVLLAFAGVLKIDLEQALAGGGGIFGEDGARVKGSAKKAKNKALWNPVTLALGLNEVHRVPLAQLKRAFAIHSFLDAWAAQWQESLALLGK